MSLKTIEPQALYALQQEDSNLVIIDVRNLEEYEEGHIQGAHLFPLDELSSNDVVAKITQLKQDSEQSLYLTCACGPRSAMACGMLVDKCLADLVMVEGGTKAWAELGLPMDVGSERGS